MRLFPSLSLNQSQTRAIELALAYQYGAAYLSVADRWGSYSNANAAGLMNADGTHPKDIGAADIEGLVEQRLVDALH